MNFQNTNYNCFGFWIALSIYYITKTSLYFTAYARANVMSAVKLPPLDNNKENDPNANKTDRNTRARMAARAQLLAARKHKHASTIQSKFRGSRARVALLELKSKPRVPLWEGTVQVAGEERRVKVEQRTLPEHLLRMISYTVVDVTPHLELSRISKTAASMRPSEAQNTAMRLTINQNNELQLKGSIDEVNDDAEEKDNIAAEMREEFGHVDVQDALLDVTDRADDAEEEQIRDSGDANYAKTRFCDLKRISVYVESAEGLPLCCTSTRVTALLLAPSSRSLYGEKIEGFSAPESSAYNPTYNLKASWKYRELQPHLTILIRIDTLERPSLIAKTIGYSALKLCVDENGEQPLESQNNNVETIRLNAGRFKLPVMLGKLPKWGNLSEEDIEGMPQLPNAWLRVRLVDARAANNADIISATVTNTTRISVALSLYLSYDRPNSVKHVLDAQTGITRSSKALSAPPLSASIGRDLRRGILDDIDEEDMEHMHNLMRGYIRDAFTLVGGQITMIIDKKYLYHYDDTCGLLVGVDVLYNLPTSAATTTTSGLTLYKTTFQYLRGEGSGLRNDPVSEEEDPRFIVDDVSTLIDFESSCRGCLVYMDDLQEVKGLGLGPEACVLVVVTKVYVYFDDVGTAVSSVSIPFNSPDNTYWGLLPLRCESPFLYPEDVGVGVEEMSDGAFVNTGSHQIPLFSGLPPEEIVTSPDPFFTLQQLLLSQIQDKYTVGCSTCFNWFVSSSDAKSAAPATAVHPSADSTSGTLVTPTGISAVIRVQDGRLRRFCNHHIVADEAGADLNTNTMMAAISLIPGHGSLLDDYVYNSLRFEHLPRLKELIPQTIKPTSITTVLSKEYVKHIQKILDAI